MIFKPFKLSVFITCVKTRFFVLFWFKDRKGIFFNIRIIRKCVLFKIFIMLERISIDVKISFLSKKLLK